MACLQIIIASTREGRKGPVVATWFEQQARAHGGFDVEVVDLASVGLPLFDEPEHPRLRKYKHAHTRAWSATVARGDAYVLVTPEYNHSPPPGLINAFDYLVELCEQGLARRSIYYYEKLESWGSSSSSSGEV